MRHPEAEAALGPRAADAVDIARRHFGHMSERQRDAALSALRSKMADRRRPRVLGWSLAAAGAVAACAVVSLLATRHRWHESALSFRVEGGELGAGGSVESGAGGHPVLRFSDGSEVVLAAGARAHVRTVDEHGANVTLDEGQAHVYVVHAPSTHWSFDAGPYVVHVTGTAFGLSWAAADDRLDVRLENGSVAVSGPVFDTPVALRAGQWLTVRSREVLIRDLSARDDAAKGSLSALGVAPAPPAEALAGEHEAKLETAELEGPAPSAGPRRHAPRPRGSVPAVSQGHGWAAELADGKFASIVDEALGLGLEPVYAGSGADDLAALADAARYTRHFDVARGALLAQRQRFAASERARVAAFSLGRLSEAQRDDRKALSWFETYLQEAPEGTYASEALGRKMILVEQLDGSDAARALAAAYLHRFPSGTYAEAAHAIAPAP
ncbi:MAG TPA: FecR family protein [Polyangiaceae bacterium]